MADVRLALTQARYALLTAFRNPRTVVFQMAFPVILLILFNSIFTKGSDETVTFAGGTITASAYFTAGLAAVGAALEAELAEQVGGRVDSATIVRTSSPAALWARGPKPSSASRWADASWPNSV